MKLLVKLLREGLGRLIIAIDFITRPRKLKRDAETQARINIELTKLSLYQFYACPFCIKTRRALHRLNLPIELRDIKLGSAHRDDLEQGGGRIKAPCLRIKDADGDKWLYESGDIISYLEQRFA